MKNLLKLTCILGVTLMFTSCLVDDTGTTAANDEGPNLASFTESSKTIGGIANGNEYEFDLSMSVIGPTVTDLTSDVTATIAVDPSSTAVEGTHFRLDSKTITLEKDQNFIGKLPITLLSEGIIAPLDTAPVLYLKVSSADGGNIVGNGKLFKITLNYLCFSNLSGTYDAEMIYTAYDGSVSNITFTDTWTETGTGEYRTAEVGHWVSGQLAGVGTPGMTVLDVCNEIIINGQYLVDYYGNWVDDLGVHGTYDPDTGTISVDYSICYPAGADNCRYYTVVYTKQ
ncbi:MAG: hypothetical protein ACO3VF_00010 [Tamlana sp.]